MGNIYSHDTSGRRDVPKREKIWSAIFRQETGSEFNRQPSFWNRLRKSGNKKSSLVRNGLGSHRNGSLEHTRHSVLHKQRTTGANGGSTRHRHSAKMKTNKSKGCQNGRMINLKYIVQDVKDEGKESVSDVDMKPQRRKQSIESKRHSNPKKQSGLAWREGKNNNYESDSDDESGVEIIDDFGSDVPEEMAEMEDLCSSILARKQKSLNNKNEDFNNSFVFSDSESELNPREEKEADPVLYFNDKAIYPKDNYPDTFVSQVSITFRKEIVLPTKRLNNMETIEEGNEDEELAAEKMNDEEQSRHKVTDDSQDKCESPGAGSFPSTIIKKRSRYMFIPPQIQ